ncbi:MAG TPA: hypothetical protein VNN79_15220 [Actinomycetota bacterium]|nr:hypothetical protein [Actinomycetota bacterium]
MANAVDTPPTTTTTAPKANPPKEQKAPKLASARQRTESAEHTERTERTVAAETPARRRGAVRRSAPWVAVALVTAAAIVFGLLWRNADSALADAQALEHQRAEVVATGTDFLTALTNFSGTTIDSDVARIKRFAVGDFAQQVDQFFGPTNTRALQKADVVSIGRVRSVFVQSIDGPQASVFGVVDEAIRNAHAAPRTETLRIDVEMLDTSAGWRVATVDILEAPGGGPLG